MIPKTPSYLQMPLQHDMMRSTISFDCRTFDESFIWSKVAIKSHAMPNRNSEFYDN